MRELVLLCFVFQLCYISAYPKSPNQVAEFSSTSKILKRIPPELFSNGNTLIEIDLLKDYYPEVRNHVIRKRNVVEQVPQPGAEGSTKRRRRRRRRRRKKPSGSSKLGPVGEGEPSQLTPVYPTQERPIGNVLDPTDGRRESRRPKQPIDIPPQRAERPPTDPPAPTHYRRSQPAPDAASIIPEKPVLREMSKEDTDGLLRAKEVQASYIRTDMMRANKLRADRVKADKIRAQDVVVVSSKTGRTRRPKKSEYIQPEPVYERMGTQRFNSIVDNPIHQSRLPSPVVKDNYYDAMQNIPSYQRLQPIENFSRSRNLYGESSFGLGLHTSSQHLDSKPITREHQYDHRPPPILPADPLPEFSSSKVLDQYSRRRIAPKLSEFVVETPFIESRNTRTRKQRLNSRYASKPDRNGPATEFLLFDNPDVHFEGTSNQGNTNTFDQTQKTYTSNTDPWYFR